MAQTIDEPTKVFLTGLRTGDVSQSEVSPWRLNDEPDKVINYEQDLSNYRQFLQDRTGSQPTADALSLRLPKSQLLDLLTEFNDERQCLLLQICYGLDRPLNQGGTLQLVNRGNYHLTAANMTDEALMASVYKVVSGGKARKYFLLNLNRNQPITVSKAEAYKLEFRKLYGWRNAKRSPYLQGTALPVKAMRKLLTDPACFGNETHLTLQWGLTTNSEMASLGNVSIFIRGENPANDAVVAFRTTKFSGPGMSDCPPKVPCQS